LTTIRAARRELFIPASTPRSGGPIQARPGLTIPLVGGDMGLARGDPDRRQVDRGPVFSDHCSSATRALSYRSSSRVPQAPRQEPRSHGRPGYDARARAAAAKRAGTLDRKAVRDQIAQTKDYEGVAGTITMGPDRNPIKPVAMIKIENGQMNFAGWVQP
jgi:branched-chain amino acid transport system substrate-binding protein